MLLIGQEILPFSNTSLKLENNYLLEYFYFTLGSISFAQLVPIPMGSVPNLFMGNLFLKY